MTKFLIRRIMEWTIDVRSSTLEMRRIFQFTYLNFSSDSVMKKVLLSCLLGKHHTKLQTSLISFDKIEIYKETCKYFLCISPKDFIHDLILSIQKFQGNMLGCMKFILYWEKFGNIRLFMRLFPLTRKYKNTLGTS